jgi:hypothetical protein
MTSPRGISIGQADPTWQHTQSDVDFIQSLTRFGCTWTRCAGARTTAPTTGRWDRTCTGRTCAPPRPTWLRLPPRVVPYMHCVFRLVAAPNAFPLAHLHLRRCAPAKDLLLRALPCPALTWGRSCAIRWHPHDGVVNPTPHGLAATTATPTPTPQPTHLCHRTHWRKGQRGLPSLAGEKFLRLNICDIKITSIQTIFKVPLLWLLTAVH